MPKAFTEPEKAMIKQSLLDQGNKLFSSLGLKKTSIEDLAQAAGISKAAFYIFYESKEALFMDVVEQAEVEFRRDVLAAVDLPGPTPRSRLYHVLRMAFTHWKNVPILQFFTKAEYEVLLRRIPPEIIEEHLRSDDTFIVELVERCRQAGIPIAVPLQHIDDLLHALFFTSLHEDDLGTQSTPCSTDILIELVAAYCLGEVSLSGTKPTNSKVSATF